MKRRGRSFGALLMVALVGCSSGGAPTTDAPAATSTPAPSTPSTAAASDTVPTVPFQPETAAEGTVAAELGDTTFDRYLAFVEERGDGAEAALAEFALSMGPVDGVDTSALEPVDATWEDSFSSALTAVEAHWEELSDEQRDAVTERFIEVLGPLDGHRATDPGAAEAPSTSAQGFARPRAAGGDAELAEWNRRARDAENWLATQLGIVGALDVEVRVSPGAGSVGAETAPSFGTAVDGHVAAWARVEFGIEVVPRDVACSIRIIATGGLDENSKRSVIAHELFHCFSMTHLGLAPHRQTRKWVQEGIATWVGEVYVGGSSYQALRWDQYLESGAQSSTWPLFTAKYSAFPFWATIHALTGDLWGEIRGILEASRGSDTATYEYVLGLLGAEQVASIASAAANRPSLGGPWLLTGPGAPGVGRGSRSPQELVGGETVDWTTPVGAQSNRSLRTGGGSWLVVEASMSGSGRWAWTRGPSELVTGASRTVSYCVDGPCLCPDGSPALDGTVDAAGELVVATTGGSTSTDGAVRTLGEADLCAPDCSEVAAAPVVGTDDVTTDGAAPVDPAVPAVPPECLEIDPCVVGTWLADPTETAAFALATFQFAPVTPTFLGGTLRFEFAEDGTFREVAEGIRFQVTIDGITGEQTYTRIVTGIWFVAGDGVLRTIPASQVTDIQQSIAGTALPPIRNEVGPEGLTTADFGYTCSPTSLALTHEAAAVWSFPQQWTRTS